MNPPTPTHHPESVEARVTWLHDVGGLSPREISWRLGVPESRVARILADAREGSLALPAEGAAQARETVLAAALCARLHLVAVRIATPLAGESGMEAVSRLGAQFLGDEIRLNRPGRIIALSHGRTIAGAAAAIPRIKASHIRFVSLLGDLTARRSAYPHEVMYTLARRLGAEAYIMPAPLYIPTRAEKEALEQISFIRDIQSLQAEADTLILGIGVADHDTQLLSVGMVERAALEMLIEQGAVGEIMGRFIDASGREIVSDLAARTISPPIDTLRGRRVVGVAGGLSKLRAIRAVLASGVVTELITSLDVAEALMES